MKVNIIYIQYYVCHLTTKYFQPTELKRLLILHYVFFETKVTARHERDPNSSKWPCYSDSFAILLLDHNNISLPHRSASVDDLRSFPHFHPLLSMDVCFVAWFNVNKDALFSVLLRVLLHCIASYLSVFVIVPLPSSCQPPLVSMLGPLFFSPAAWLILYLYAFLPTSVDWHTSNFTIGILLLILTCPDFMKLYYCSFHSIFISVGCFTSYSDSFLFALPTFLF